MKKIKHIVFGGAGFVGINLVKKLQEKNETILVVDNLSNSRKDILFNISNKNMVFFKKLNINNKHDMKGLSKNYSFDRQCIVWHLAANSDIASGIDDINVDLNDTFLTTIAILEFCKMNSIKQLAFASSSAVYGNLDGIAVSEEHGPLYPISNYGAMKLASEAVISAAFEQYLDKSIIFRFPNVVGFPSTHGVIHDFINKLKLNPNMLNVLGDGNQQKCYVHSEDLVEMLINIFDKTNGLDILNIGPDDDGIKVSRIAELVVNKMSQDAEIRYEDKKQGWVGDVPVFKYDSTKMIALGFKPLKSSEEAVIQTISQILTESF